MNNRQKMRQTNQIVRKILVKHSFVNLYFFPHLRFQKDWVFDNCSFDAIGWKNGRKRICFFQIKTNQGKIPKKELEQYYLIENKYHCKCFWLNRVKNIITAYGPECPEGRLI